MGNQLDALAKRPSSTYLKYQEYEINGFIEEIWELAYGPLKAALFHCQWVRLEEINTDSEGFTTVDLTKTAYRDDPFVLEIDVMQVFYARDNKTKGRLKAVLEREKEDCRCRWSDG